MEKTGWELFRVPQFRIWLNTMPQYIHANTNPIHEHKHIDIHIHISTYAYLMM